ncbi:MAG: hypothetical protein APF78_10745 [Sphingomonadales bacterium BRH_c3]|nr:MAG: hypothetical protein APF78_10745 [Sphingomonadales bacterium BRH_c3]
MSAVLKSLGLAFSQMGDRAVLRVLAKSVALTLVVFALLGVAAFQAIAALSTYIGMNIGAEATYLASLVLTLLAAWLLFRVVALAVLQFFADEVVIAVERKHYPQAASTARQLPFHRDLANSLRGAGRALLFNALAAPVALVLLFTAIGPAVVFLLVNAVLLGRELTDMGWLRHRPAPTDPSPVSRFDRLLLGGVIAALMAVPFINLLAPIIGAAAGTHLVQLSRPKAT